MRRLFVNAVSCKAGGGVNDLVHTLPLLAAGLGECGWTVHTWVVEAGRRALREAGYPADGVTTIRASSPWARAWWELVGFPRIVRRRRPTAVFQFSNFIFRGLAVPQLTVLRSPTFFSKEYASRRRTGVYPKLRYRLGCRYSAKTVRLADAVFCISETHRRDIIDTLGPGAEKVRVAYLGFSLPESAAALRDMDRRAVVQLLPAELREKLLPVAGPERKIVLNVAHYYEHKNLGDLLEAVDTLSAGTPGVGLILTAGLTRYDGPWGDRTRRDVKLARELAERGVLFDVGPVPKECVWKLLALADVFAFPSSLESFGHPLLEAMSMGVPVVAADTPIHREIAADAALFHAVADPDALARRLRAILGGEADVSQLLARGKRRAAEFRWEEHVATLREAICHHSAGPGRCTRKE